MPSKKELEEAFIAMTANMDTMTKLLQAQQAKQAKKGKENNTPKEKEDDEESVDTPMSHRSRDSSRRGSVTRSVSSPPTRRDDIRESRREPSQLGHRRHRHPSPALRHAGLPHDRPARDYHQAAKDMQPKFEIIEGKLELAGSSKNRSPIIDYLPTKLRYKASKKDWQPSPLEHILGIALIGLEYKDPTIVKEVLYHVSEVVEDTLERDWEGVKDWSNTVLDKISKGYSSWLEVDDIQRDRTKMSWARNLQDDPTMETPCPDYNRGKCDKKATHDGPVKNVKLTHVCAVCLAAKDENRTDHQGRNCYLWLKPGGKPQFNSKKPKQQNSKNDS